MVDLGIHETLLHDVVENKGNTRLKHKLFKVFKGEDLHLAVIGGSNTAGGGLQEDEGRTDGIFFRVISDWWRKTITPITGSRFKTRQIAMGGTGSDFFQYCHHSYVQDNVDLVLLEMSVNDLHELPYNVNLSLPIEQLTRQLLEYPTEPALLYVNLLSGRSYYQGCTNLEDFGQRLLSDVYKVTTFSWRDAVCPIVGGRYRAPLKSLYRRLQRWSSHQPTWACAHLADGDQSLSRSPIGQYRSRARVVPAGFPRRGNSTETCVH